jgi:Ni/Fe-hydrogenase subunit HybB-like protein
MSGDGASVRRVSPRWGFRLTWARIGLLGVVGFTAGLVVYRLFEGLGPPTNLTDRWPWALWTWWKLTGVALAGAGYSTALVVHFVGRDRWKDVERGAFITSLLGYLMVCTALILDLGQWFNAWRPVFFWGYHSVMFELFWCIGGYTVVQLVEFLYIYEERVRVPAALRRTLTRIYGPLLIVGALLPVFHQSALCSLYVIAKGRMDPLWWSQLLPLFAILTSFYVGPAVVVVENHLSARIYGRRVDRRVLGEMVSISAVVMAVYLALRVGDLVVRGALGGLFDGSFEGNVALVELTFGVALPMAMFASRRVRSTSAGLLWASGLAIAGVALNRFNIVIVAMADATGAGMYVPYWMEAVFVLGLGAAVALAYLFLVENFPILPIPDDEPSARVERPQDASLVLRTPVGSPR